MQEGAPYDHKTTSATQTVDTLLCLLFSILSSLFLFVLQDGQHQLDFRLYTSLTTNNQVLYVIPIQNILEKFLLCQSVSLDSETQEQFCTTCAICFQVHPVTAGRTLAMARDAGC
jgi:hypothetical protein